MRFVRLIILCIALGFVTTVAVAWLAAWLPQPKWTPQFVERDHAPVPLYAIVWELVAWGAVRRDWFVTTGNPRVSSPSELEDPRITRRVARLKRSRLSGPEWGDAGDVLASPSKFAEDGNEHATGWPLLSAWYSLQRQPFSGRTTVEGGIALPYAPKGRYLPVSTYQLRALPLRPIWTGLLVNTVFYAALWFIPLGGVGLVRRWRRRRRGQCPRCAYDLAGLTSGQPCPECGNACPSPQASPATA